MIKHLLVPLTLSWLVLAGGAAAQTPFEFEPVARFERPWAVAALPQGGFLVTEQAGRLRHVAADGEVSDIEGAPAVTDAGQVGLHDVALAPDFASSSMVYLTWVDGQGGGALHLGRGRLDLERGLLDGLEVLWQATPSGGNGHPGAIIAFGPDGYLYLSSGDRQLGAPAQDLADHRGKILRLNGDGAPAAGNPFPEAPTIWTYGHRNPYGLIFDQDGRLWSHEMGPRGGDELNLIVAGQNYGWPAVSEGRRYSGLPIPDHATRPDVAAPKVAWVPSIAPSGMIIVTGSVEGAAFAPWQGSLLLGGLGSQALIRVEIDGTRAREVARWDMGRRIRDVVQGADGYVYLLEDGADGQLMRLRPQG